MKKNKHIETLFFNCDTLGEWGRKAKKNKRKSKNRKKKPPKKTIKKKTEITETET